MLAEQQEGNRRVPNAHRLGLFICLAVPGILVAQGVAYAGFRLQTGPARLGDVGESLAIVGGLVGGACPLVAGLWQGRPGYRWFGFGVLVLFGACLLGLAYWQITWGFPNASSPEEQAKMHARTVREWPWVAAWGVLNILTGALLLLAPVGQFLRAQRARRA